MHEHEVLYNAYYKIDDFKDYVNKICEQRGISKWNALNLEIVRQYYLYLIDKGEDNDDRTKKPDSSL